MKRILRLFRDMKFRYKLILTYIFICAVPVLFFGGFSFARVQNESDSADKTTLELPFNRQEANWMQSSHGRKVRCVH